MTEKLGHKTIWTFVITSIALVMVTLDNLVVTTALPVIRHDLHATLEGLEWTVNAYTLTFAVLLLTGAALGDRFGRRRLFVLGLGIFTAASAFAALAPSIEALNVARALQGVGGAIVTPLTLTLLSAAVPANRRGLALGAWGGIGGLAVALGPLVGGAVVSGSPGSGSSGSTCRSASSYPACLAAPRGELRPAAKLDLPGLGLASVGLLGIVWGLVRGNSVGWGSPEIVGSLAVGAVLVALFVLWELRTDRRCCRCASSATGRSRRRTSPRCSCSSGCSARSSCSRSSSRPCRATRRSAQACACCRGRRCRCSSRRSPARSPTASAARAHGRRPRAAGDRARLAGAVVTPTTPYVELVGPFILSGVGMGLFFAPVANVILGSVRRREEGQASGANNAIRELGGVFGVAVLASIFASYGGYGSGQSFVDGMGPAVWVGAIVVGLGAIAALTIPRGRRARVEAVESAPALERAA